MMESVLSCKLYVERERTSSVLLTLNFAYLIYVMKTESLYDRFHGNCNVFPAFPCMPVLSVYIVLCFCKSTLPAFGEIYPPAGDALTDII